MYMPGIFGEDLFDNWMEDAMNSRSSNDRRGYARNDSGLMRTDIREAGGNYVLEIELPGFKKDIRGITRFEDLPKEAQEYVLFIEKEIGAPITMVSTGPKREEIIHRA